jgi:hypothetical protein
MSAGRTVVEYETAANRHRPESFDDFVPTIRGLHGQGLRVRDIAQALRISDADVANAIAADGDHDG